MYNKKYDFRENPMKVYYDIYNYYFADVENQPLKNIKYIILIK